MWISKETAKGILKYRMPNILEAYDLLESAGQGGAIKPSILSMKRNIISSMGSLVDFSSVDGVKSYDDLLTLTDDMIQPLSDIADEIIVKTFDAFKKKSS
jgi:hypothetical protein